MSWIDRVFRRRSLYDDLGEEMRGHLEEKTEQFMREGMPREDAERAARRAFGNVMLLEERGREVWQWRWVENLLRDVTFSARLLKKSPGFTLVAILTLTLGIGANTAIFSLLNGLLLRPLPVPTADRLVSLQLAGMGTLQSFSPALARTLESRHDVFANVFIYAEWEMKVNGGTGNQTVSGVYVSGQYFSAFGVEPQIGRALDSADDSKDSKSTAYPAVISDAFWLTRFNRDPGVIGKSVVLNGVPFTIVGVMPKGFFGFDPTARPQIWIPLETESRVDAPFDEIDGGAAVWWLNMGALLRPGVSLEKANAWLRSASPRMAASALPANFQIFHARRSDISVSAEAASNGFSFLRKTYRRPLVLIFIFCCGLLLLACINLASLLLARAAVRQREIATRLAIGASRRRILQQLLVDSLLIALLGTGAGLALAPLASHALVAMLNGGRDHIYLDASLDWRVCLFVVVTAALSTVVVGLIPAWQATAGDLNRSLKEGVHATRAEHRLLPKVLLATEVALALVLVSAAGLLSTSLYRLYHAGFGFDPHHLVLMNMDLDKQPMKGADRMRFFADLRDQLAGLPGVESVAYAEVAPLSGTTYMDSMHAPGSGDRDVYTNKVSTGYLKTMRTPLLAGRAFTEQDVSSKTSGVILINENAARIFFPGENAVGKMLKSGYSKDAGQQIVGIVGDAKYQNVHVPAPPTVYNVIATAGKTDSSGIQPDYTFFLRTMGPPAQVISSVRDVVRQMGPGIPAPTFTTMEHQISEYVVSERVMALLSIFFAACALLMTGIGLYGVLAWSTARRTSEIGVRMALGARRAQVVTLIFRENLWTAITGCLAGLAVAVLASHAIASFLYGTSPRSPWILSGALTLLCLVAAGASLVPALRAASIDPMQALRAE